MSAEVLVPVEVAVLEPFAVAGVLGAADVHVAALLARRVPGLSADVLLAAALAARAPQHGHVCVELASVAERVVIDGLSAEQVAALPWPDPEPWVREVAASPVVATDEPGAPDPATGAIRPLVLRGDRLTVDRYARYERSVADQLRRRATSTSAPLVAEADLTSLLDGFFGQEDPADPDLQRRAAAAALVHPLAVIAGGPGTGKTHTVARLLAAAQAAAATDGRPLQVALVAPTGKAAARMAEALQGAIADAGATDGLHDVEAMTVHRLLGPTGGIRFRHDASAPLPHDLVIMDETSMASLPLMARLLDAVRPDAHVVLVGDPDQLASVEAGAVLGEIVRSANAGGPHRDVTVTLRQVHRFAATSPIAALATAIAQGDADAALAVLDDPHRPDAQLIDPARASDLDDVLARAALRQIEAAVAGEGPTAMAAAQSVKLLAATRRGPNGVAEWQQRIERLVAHRSDVDPTRRLYVGKPVMVTRNQPVNGLFNGDTGVMVHTERGPRLWFGANGGNLFEAGRLDQLETWWAMTIHKSQGSEFAHAAIALPEPGSPILTRQLLYTAVTRAKDQVTIVASRASVRAAIERQVPRSSSLADLLSEQPGQAG